jgi:pyruvate/2-oxoglutarate dehydrogenase complex dihydrolipoamide acyltransferase (E2) component
VQDGKVIDKGDAPGPMWRFDYGQKSWVQDEAVAWSIVRKTRNLKLQSSDWTEKTFAIGRLGMAQFHAWQQYRQALRDVPLQGSPYEVVWPQVPSH